MHPSSTRPLEAHDEHKGPPLLVLAIVSTALFVASLVTTAILTHGGHLPSPYEAPSTSAAFFGDYGDAVRVNAFLQLGAAIVLGLFAAVAVSRLRFFGVTAAGVTIALFGGMAGAVFAALSALVQWVLASVDVAMLPMVSNAFHWLYFALGGPAHVAAAGLLVAGISVSGGIAGLLPRWILWSGLVLAVVAEVSTLMMIVPAAVYLLPVARLFTFVWMIAVGATLPKSWSTVEKSPRSERSVGMREAHQTP